MGLPVAGREPSSTRGSILPGDEVPYPWMQDIFTCKGKHQENTGSQRGFPVVNFSQCLLQVGELAGMIYVMIDEAMEQVPEIIFAVVNAFIQECLIFIT